MNDTQFQVDGTFGGPPLGELPANEITVVPTVPKRTRDWQQRKGRERNAALRALIDAAMKQPNPSPELVAALGALSTL